MTGNTEQSSRPRLRLETRQILRDDRGGPAVEFALVSPVLILLLLGVVDFGMGYWNQLQANQAVQAGAAYVVHSGFDATAISKAITSGGPDTMQATPAPAESCGCPNATGGVSTASGTPPLCFGTCPGGTSPGVYVTINAQYPYTTIFSWPGLPRPIQLTSSTMVRVQ